MKYFLKPTDVSIDELKKTDGQVTLADYPSAHQVEKNILIYDGHSLRKQLTSVDQGELKDEVKNNIKSELHHALKEGPGVLVIKNFYSDRVFMETGVKLFEKIIQKEKASGKGGDHFAPNHINSRIWNSLEKMFQTDPEYYIEYFGNPLYDLISEAWLGSGYQITSQVNLVNPGGSAQMAHRDYHLGFQNNEVIANYPLTLQIASQYLTLQGAIAHSDMPLESGPTQLLPFSQKYPLGYLAMKNPEVTEYFKTNMVQSELETGDALFFSPALFHAAGENRTQSHRRMANLIQISAAFGKPMELVNRLKICKQIYPMLLEKLENGMPFAKVEQVVKSTAESYPFPTNLDIIQPNGESAPLSDQQIMLQALKERQPTEVLIQQLDARQI